MAAFEDQVGTVGTLVGAALETAGHYMQSQFLDAIAVQSVWTSFGALLFSLGFITMLFIIAIGGNYKFFTWFLCGPALFSWLVFVRVDSDGAKWKLGQRDYDQQAVTEAAQGVIGDAFTESGRKKPQVSLFFKVYSQLVSDVVYAFVRSIRVIDANADADFISKMQRFFSLKRPQLTEPMLKGFFNVAFVNNCARYMILKRLLADAKTDDVRAEYYRKVEEELATAEKANVWEAQAGDPFYQWADKLGLFADGSTASKSTYTCPELWGIMIKAFKKHGRALVEEIAVVNLSPEAKQDPKQMRDELFEKFGIEVKREGTRNENPDSGDQITDDEAVNLVINEVAGRLILAQLSQMSPGLIAEEAGRYKQEVKTKGEKRIFDPNRQLRLLQSTEQYQSIGDFLSAMLAMPYIQGLGLYCLSFAFPFFAMAVIIPGRHQAFLLWMGLWFWLKSWDIGFSVVMVIDKMLFALMPHNAPITEDKMKDVGNLFKSLLEVDPTYSVHTYYNLIATCILAVPVVTGLLVRKGGIEVQHALSEGYHNFSGKIGQSMAAFNRSLKATSNLARVGKNMYMATYDSLWKGLTANPEVGASVLKRLGFSVGKDFASKLSGMGSEKFKFLSEVAGKLGEPLVGAAFDAETQRIVYGWRAEVYKAAYNASKSPVNLALAWEATTLRWFSHDQRDNKLYYAQREGQYEAIKKYYFPTGSTYRRAYDLAGEKLLGTKSN